LEQVNHAGDAVDAGDSQLAGDTASAESVLRCLG
jgi:hypothetical protein